jgi:hypothetical protein
MIDFGCGHGLVTSSHAFVTHVTSSHAYVTSSVYSDGG